MEKKLIISSFLKELISWKNLITPLVNVEADPRLWY
jgi:hypothetical protein